MARDTPAIVLSLSPVADTAIFMPTFPARKRVGVPLLSSFASLLPTDKTYNTGSTV